jgi:4-amino-4-deoxy-L-arabinose transferase-like glycosyltransferase
MRIADCGLRIYAAAHSGSANHNHTIAMKSDPIPQQLPTSARSPGVFQSAIRFHYNWPQSAIFLLMLIASWQRWSSVIADSGRELDLPLRLLNGEWLYRDVHYLYPPLSPYFNALLYRVFGPHMSVLQISGVLCALLLVWLCSRIAQRLLPPKESALAVCGVIVFCVFKPAGNLISPYAYAALHAMLLALTVLWFTLRYAESKRSRELISASLCVGLAAITKQEFALAAALTLVATLFYLHRKDWPTLARGLLLAALPALVTAVPVYAWLFQHIGWPTLVEDCHLVFTHLPASLVYYNHQRTGLTQPLASLWQMLGAVAVCGAVASLVCWWSARRHNSTLALRALLLCGTCLLVAFLVGFTSAGQWDGSPLRALPLLLLALIVVEWRRSNDADQAHFIVAVYSLAVLARVALRVPSGGAFGSFFLPTSLLLVYGWLTQSLPQALQSWTQNAQTTANARTIGRGLFVAAWLITAIVFGIRYRKNYSYEINTPRGTLYTTRQIGPVYRAALDFITTHTQPNEAIAVLPEGSDLTFLSSRRMPLRHQILIPGLMSERDETAAIELLARQRVRYVLIINRPMREFGAVAFGRDYYSHLGSWIDTHYRLVHVFGASGRVDVQIGATEFFIKVLARYPMSGTPP